MAKDLFVRLQGLRKVGAVADRLNNLVEAECKPRTLSLVGEDLERFQHRDTGTEHRRQLPRKDFEFALLGRSLLGESLLVATRLAEQAAKPR